MDHYIRTELQQMRSPVNLIEPSAQFAERVVNQAVLIEKQRRARIGVWFAILALTPYALRELWSLIRGDFVSVTSLPFGNAVSQIYTAFMSSTATYVLIVTGFLLAFYVVGLPSWRRQGIQRRA